MVLFIFHWHMSSFEMKLFISVHCEHPPHFTFNFICIFSSDYKTQKKLYHFGTVSSICMRILWLITHTNTTNSNCEKFQSVNHWNITQQKNKIWAHIFKLAQRFKDNMPYPAAQDVTEWQLQVSSPYKLPTMEQRHYKCWCS